MDRLCLSPNHVSLVSLSKTSPVLHHLHPWIWPAHPWESVHVDFAGPIEGHMDLIVVDVHSKWPDVSIMNSSTTSKTIQVLRGLFSHYGVPNFIVSDNGPQFLYWGVYIFPKGKFALCPITPS